MIKVAPEQRDTLSQMHKIFKIFDHSEGEIRPHFIVTGPSGVGKSFNIQQLCEYLGLNYFEINAAQLTKEGISGNSLSKALTPALQAQGRPTVCFVDEFDKLFISGNSNSDHAHESSNGVQNEFLKVLESRVTSVFGDYGKYIEVNVENILFVFAGAFNGEENLTLDRLREFGIKTEFLGRVGLVFNLEKLSIESLNQALIHSKLLNQYLELYTDVKREDVISAIMAEVVKAYDNNTLGVRLLNTLLHQYFINGGKISSEDTKKSTFTKKLSLHEDAN